MSSLDITIPHNLSQEEATTRIKGLLTKTKQDYGDKISNLQEEWNGPVGTFSFTIMGFDISGQLTVNPSSVELEGKIPFAASLFKGAITQTIKEKAGQLLQ